ncbi:hypothetical protein N7534_005308 [Penicillium rubens]|nr:hypothetical protein N7534_005276 [Penicillium rubens]KAJ5860022.1 hypothetical protein N7534_005299 [Penicillium rubens]KAJ5860031.1 hypothetical protein N7534_005308 [Penicillium rubens]
MPASEPKRVPRGVTFRGPLTDRPNRRWPARGEVHRHECRLNPASESGRKRFPFNNFTCFLTLFSKCFSSFDHSTCALSVSGQYLALDEIYHPFRAAFPNNSTRRRSFTRARDTPSHTGFSPSMTSRSRALRWGPLPKHPLQITMRTPKEPAFKFELLPLHSPLLGQSLLVSFPPLIDMLKFSGYPYLIRGQPG